ncbi:MAG: putative iron-regulated protein [Pseudohongiellaceae bacterium]|jgi:uncharacterized iron-regulated protein
MSAVALLISSSVFAQLENPQWESKLYSDHELVGILWNVKNASVIPTESLLTELAGADYLLLGEKHDNPDHHTLQLLVTEAILQSNKLYALSMEMMDSTIQPKLDLISDQDFDSLDDLKNYLEWDSDGWNWDFYSPLIQLAVNASVPIYAGNISRDAMRDVYAAEQPSPLQKIVGTQVMNQLIKDIDASHCGLLPESQYPPMVAVQQARDSAMANSLPQPQLNGLSVLIAGNYHARQDLGVPNYLLARGLNLGVDEIVSLAFMEVSEGLLSASDYVESTAGVSAYDYIWFTPAISNEDYCAAMVK